MHDLERYFVVRGEGPKEVEAAAVEVERPAAELAVPLAMVVDVRGGQVAGAAAVHEDERALLEEEEHAAAEVALGGVRCAAPLAVSVEDGAAEEAERRVLAPRRRRQLRVQVRVGARQSHEAEAPHWRGVVTAHRPPQRPQGRPRRRRRRPPPPPPPLLLLLLLLSASGGRRGRCRRSGRSKATGVATDDRAALVVVISGGGGGGGGGGGRTSSAGPSVSGGSVQCRSGSGELQGHLTGDGVFDPTLHRRHQVRAPQHRTRRRGVPELLPVRRRAAVGDATAEEVRTKVR